MTKVPCWHEVRPGIWAVKWFGSDEVSIHLPAGRKVYFHRRFWKFKNPVRSSVALKHSVPKVPQDSDVDDYREEFGSGSVKPIPYEHTTRWGDVPVLGDTLFRVAGLAKRVDFMYRTSPRCASVLPWNDVVVGLVDVETLKKHDDDTTASQLIKPKDDKANLIMLVIALALGFFIGYFVTSGGMKVLTGGASG